MESTPEQAAEGKAVVTVLAAVLERLVKSNTQSTNPNGASPEITKFHALKAPGISIKQYLERVSFFLFVLHKKSVTTVCSDLICVYLSRHFQNSRFTNMHPVPPNASCLL